MKPVKFHEAIEFALERGVVLPATYYGELVGAAKSYGFSVSGVNTLSQLQGVQDSLTKAVSTGMHFDAWKKDVLSGKLPIAEFPKHRLELIYRNFNQTAFNKGRCVKQQKVKKQRPVLLYSAVGDNRTREEHNAMDGFMDYVDSGIWDVWYPQNGHLCRCRTINLTLKQAIAMGFDPDTIARLPEVDGNVVEPDKGWDYSVCSNVFKGQELSMARKQTSLAPFLAKRLDQYNPVKLPTLDKVKELGKVGQPVPPKSFPIMRDNLKKKLAKEGISTKTPANILSKGADGKYLTDLSKKLPDNITVSGDYLGGVQIKKGQFSYQFKNGKGIITASTKKELAMGYFRHLRLANPELDDFFQQYFINREGKLNIKPSIAPWVETDAALAGQAGAVNVMPDIMASVFTGNQAMFNKLYLAEPELFELAFGVLTI